MADDLRKNPEMGDRIQGLGGVRKIRFAMPSRKIGKSGGGRAIYLSLVRGETIILIRAYAKSEQTDFSRQQRRHIQEFLKELKNG